MDILVSLWTSEMLFQPLTLNTISYKSPKLKWSHSVWQQIFNFDFSVSEKDETLDHKEEVVIGLSVPLGVSLIVNVILCLTTCYYYIIYKEECKGEKKGEQFLN